jgi:hypothetical protein
MTKGFGQQPVKGDPIFTIIEPKGRPKKEEEQK